jgi:hypothetical protein
MSFAGMNLSLSLGPDVLFVLSASTAGVTSWDLLVCTNQNRREKILQDDVAQKPNEALGRHALPKTL